MASEEEIKTARRKLFDKDFRYFGNNYKEIYDNFYKGRELFITDQIRSDIIKVAPNCADLGNSCIALMEIITRMHHGLDTELIRFNQTHKSTGKRTEIPFNGDYIHSVEAYYVTPSQTKVYVPIKIELAGEFISRQSCGICTFDPPLTFMMRLQRPIAEIDIPENVSSDEIVLEVGLSYAAYSCHTIDKFSVPYLLVKFEELDKLIRETEEDVPYIPCFRVLSPETLTKAIGN